MAEEELTPQDEQAPELEPAAEAAAPPSPPPAGEGVPMQIGNYISKGWEIVKADPVLFILGLFVLSAISNLTGGLLAGPMVFGFMRVAQKRIKGEAAEFGELFGGFSEFGKSFLAGILVMAVFLVAGIVLAIPMIILMFIPCINIIAPLIPAIGMIFIGPAVFYTLPIAALSDAQPMDALKKSFAFFKTHVWSMVLLTLVIGLVGQVGILLCCVGALVTMPIAVVAIVVSYNEYYLPNAAQAE